jgi:transcriptional regulator with PAS, ATPase and Fis domain
MNWVDVAIVVIVAWFTFSAFSAGVIREVVTIVGVALGVVLAGLFYKDLADDVRRQAFPRPVVDPGTVRPLEEVEKEYILAVLALNGGNQTHTAEQLRIGAATLYRRLKSYGMIGRKRTDAQDA